MKRQKSHCPLCLNSVGIDRKLLNSHLIPKSILPNVEYASASGSLKRESLTEIMLCGRIQEKGSNIIDCEQTRIGSNENLYYSNFWKPYLENPLQIFTYNEWFFYTIVSIAYRNLQSNVMNPDNFFSTLKECLRLYTLNNYRSAPNETDIRVFATRVTKKFTPDVNEANLIFLNMVLSSEAVGYCCAGPFIQPGRQPNQQNMEIAVVSLCGLHFIVTCSSTLNKFNDEQLLPIHHGTGTLDLSTLDYSLVPNIIIWHWGRWTSSSLYIISCSAQNVPTLLPDSIAVPANQTSLEPHPDVPIIIWLHNSISYDVDNGIKINANTHTLQDLGGHIVGPYAVKFCKIKIIRSGVVWYIVCIINSSPIVVVQFKHCNEDYQTKLRENLSSNFKLYILGELKNKVIELDQ